MEIFLPISSKPPKPWAHGALVVGLEAEATRLPQIILALKPKHQARNARSSIYIYIYVCLLSRPILDVKPPNVQLLQSCHAEVFSFFVFRVQYDPQACPTRVGDPLCWQSPEGLQKKAPKPQRPELPNLGILKSGPPPPLSAGDLRVLHQRNR